MTKRLRNVLKLSTFLSLWIVLIRGTLCAWGTPVQSAEGYLYLVSEVCDDGFQIIEARSSGELACLRYFQGNQKNYTDATLSCSSFGAYLASVRTTEKLQVVKNLVTDSNAWIGLDDMVTEGLFVWSIDGGTLTDQQLVDNFADMEPNDENGFEDCVEFTVKFQSLNDNSCYRLADYICEKKTLALEN
ncbi:hypothetical protein RRG08_042030 [Elysia crispata]|uniref:C-type lectin domain-containing protein n=1 Tax=Elysia crispata TaxID=231223 RepID=A0AAE0Z8L8_9GAST|nr:hypothetical protein RRG08_042030 [Elysia crispata]